MVVVKTKIIRKSCCANRVMGENLKISATLGIFEKRTLGNA
jgi:hypothetical protein